MNSSRFITVIEEEVCAQVREVVPASQGVYDTYPVRPTIFHRPRWWRVLWRNVMIGFITFLERLTGNQLWSENFYQDLRFLSPEGRATLLQLKEDGVLQSWRMNQVVPGLPYMAYVSLTPEAVIVPSGKSYTMTGSTGTGVASTLNEAMYPAVGEFIERLAACDWSERSDIVIQKNDLLSTKFIAAEKFRWLTDEQYAASDLLKDRILTEKSEISWISVSDLHTGRRRYVPAQLAFIFYNFEHLHEPFIAQVSSNGVAAHTTKTAAVYGALTEVVERDAFMRQWHHGVVPKKISVPSIIRIIPELSTFILAVQAAGIEIHVLDCTSDIAEPVLAIVCCDPVQNGVMVTTACDHDPVVAMMKATKEISKFINSISRTDPSIYSAYKKNTYHLGSFDDRYNLWSQVEMVDEIRWFLTGDTVTFDTVMSEYPVSADTGEAKLRELKSKLATAGIEVYIADITNQLSRKYNLQVVRAISPQLVPVYFGEWEIPLAKKRLTHDITGKLVKLNRIPHPFV